MTPLALADDRPLQQLLQRRAVQRLGRAAVAALYDELALDPKPGLVSMQDSGSHRDMDAATFMRSLFALRRAFLQLAALGATRSPFALLEREGIAAEQRMLRATRGVNTHRGAIFTLGLLCASGGALTALGMPLDAAQLPRTLLAQWGDALAARASMSRHGGLRGAGAEAALGFPTLFEVTLPALRAATRAGLASDDARLQALFATMAVLADTNLARRGGLAGLRWVRCAAQDWLRAGGAARPDGLAHARALHRDFVRRRLSPGGAADMLAAALWVQRVCGERA